jgi:hypothetical protein
MATRDRPPQTARTPAVELEIEASADGTKRFKIRIGVSVCLLVGLIAAHAFGLDVTLLLRLAKNLLR